MNFLEHIFSQLNKSADRVVLAESQAGRSPQEAGQAATGSQLLADIATARAFLRASGLRKGDRCGLVAPNSIRWTALDLAILAEGAIAVPLYARQATAELAVMLRDAGANLICCGDTSLRDAIAAELRRAGSETPQFALFDEIFGAASASATSNAPPAKLGTQDPVAILYTSGTSGEAKGVILNVGNVDHMLSCTASRLDQLMRSVKREGSAPDRVFHYLPCCFAGSWILLLSCLSRNSTLTLSMDLTKLADEINDAAPHYFLNVPTLPERIRTGVEDSLRKRGGFLAKTFDRACAAWLRLDAKTPRPWDVLWLGLAGALIFPSIRKRLGPNLRALICGSAPLARETQLFFGMLGIPVLQVYGLTETTAICTMDDPGHIEPGRVGPAIPGIEMELGDNSEILVRGPNIFPGYWNRQAQTAQALHDGWFHTGDQGDVNDNGNWRITGRLKNLIILNSGHNIAPEPIEDELLRTLRGAQQVVLVGNGRSFLVAIVTGEVAEGEIGSQIERLNATLPHYRKIRMFHVARQPFTIESGLLTANGKLKRDAIAARFATEIEKMYSKKHAASVLSGDTIMQGMAQAERMNEYSGKTLSWTTADGVVELALHHDPANEIGTAMLGDFEHFVTALTALEAEAGALIIYSKQKAGFSAGADLRELYSGAKQMDTASAVSGVREFLERIHAVLNRLDMTSLTTIAAVHGVCFGGGFELALACDLIVADKMARFCFPELRLGLIPGFGGIPRLKRDIGNGLVRDLLLTGRSINATKALAAGLASQVAAEGESLRAARTTASQITKFDRTAASSAKRFIKTLPADELRREIDAFCELFARPAVMRGLQKFVEDTGAHPYLP